MLLYVSKTEDRQTGGRVNVPCLGLAQTRQATRDK